MARSRAAEEFVGTEFMMWEGPWSGFKVQVLRIAHKDGKRYFKLRRSDTGEIGHREVGKILPQLQTRMSFSDTLKEMGV